MEAMIKACCVFSLLSHGWLTGCVRHVTTMMMTMQAPFVIQHFRLHKDFDIGRVRPLALALPHTWKPC
jgi:hypothetical protein